MTAKLNAAGFGLDDTDYRSAAMAVEYRMTKRLALIGGYRVAKGRFDNPSGLALDLKGDGPMIALSYRR